VAGIATQVHRERLLRNLNENNKLPTNPQAQANLPSQGDEALPPTPPELHHHISGETRHKVFLAEWLGNNEDDPALKVFFELFFYQYLCIDFNAGLSPSPQDSSSQSTS
jgi:hypothetical protein